MASPLTRLFKASFKLGLAVNAALTRSPLRVVEQRLLTPLFVHATRMVRGTRQVEPAAAALAGEWERLLASRRAAHVTEVVPAADGRPETAYGEISVDCPLRGTGDVHACHRLMAYDRKLLEAAGGQLVVLESQATPGRTSCRVAIRATGASTADLVPAHLRPAAAGESGG